MTIDFKKLFALLAREWIELRSPRVLVTLALFGLCQAIMMSAGKFHGRLEDTFLIFMVGGLAAMVVSFDAVSKEREHHTLDLLLVQGLPRAGIFLVKWITALFTGLVVALVFCIGTLVGTLLSGTPPVPGDLLAELGMTGWLMVIYSLLALACSILFRRGKWAMAGSAFAWVLLRPSLVSLLIMTPLESLLGLSREQIWGIMAYLPEFSFRLVLDPGRGMPRGVTIPTENAALALTGYLCLFTLLSAVIFFRQDEPGLT